MNFMKTVRSYFLNPISSILFPRFSLPTICLLLFACIPIDAANLAVTGIAVMDMSGAVRASFSSNERLMFRQKVTNSLSDSHSKIVFRFTVYNPANASVFVHSGNAAPATAGQAQTQIAGVPVSQFYSTPGAYKLVGLATYGAETVSQEVSFTISSPNIILTYPPNGARNMSDKPLMFRWVSSGASKYRVTVGSDFSMYNSVFSQTNSGESYLSYPDVVTDPRQNLAAEQVYYWKVEGLDAAGNIVAKMASPSNFTIKSTAITMYILVLLQMPFHIKL